MNARWAATADLVVVGSGVAGLTAALRARRLGLRVLVVTKARADDGNTRWAQGGVAVVTEPPDTIANHVADTLTAGAGLCDEDAVRAILAGGPAAVAALRRHGARFDTGPDGRPARTREGGHSAFRVIHAGGDATGAEIERALLAAAGSVPVLEGHTALDVLLSDSGAVAGLAALADGGADTGGADGGADGGAGGGGRAGAGAAGDAEGRAGAGGHGGVARGRGAGVVGELRAPAVLLATGGLGQLYLATTNPDVATGDGIALALRAGATVADLEFVQFHPTVLFTGAGARGRRPLVTEAVRGEGAVLLDATGARLMAGVHPLADLAPRDVVAAAITRRMAETGTDHVHLDATHLGAVAFAERFPTVHAACVAAGIDPSTEPIPVAPAAHYSCGGVESTVDGRTAVAGLYAAGEVARTGLHGANRLASNSLLEGLVVGTRAADAVAADLALRAIVPSRPVTRPGAPAPAADRDLLQHAMSRHAGIGRDLAGLTAAAALVEASLSPGSAIEAAALVEASLSSGGALETSMTPAGAIVAAAEVSPRPGPSARPGGATVAAMGASVVAQPSTVDGAAPVGRPRRGGGAADPPDTGVPGAGRVHLEDAALTLTAAAVLAAAMARTESRGCHVRTDHPATDDRAWRHSLSVRLDERGRPVPVQLARVAS